MKLKLDSVITATLVCCALVTTAVVVRREFLSASAGRAQTDEKPFYIREWRAHLAAGRRIGQSDTPVQFIEFADFECPYCGTFHKDTRSVLRRYPTQVSIFFVHYPLPMHRFAIPAARVAECAGEQGRFEAMYDGLFDGQDQFGLKPWDDYARAAGVPDIPAFEMCSKKTDSIPRVEEGKALGAKLDVRGTPTIIINGWKLGRPPNEDELDQMVKRILAGKSPVDGKS